MITVDGYSDIERIGCGGLGDVYRATRDSTGGTVAIKVLRDVADASVAWHRTRRELTALVSLSGHAHVIQLLELLDLPGGPALVMEYAPGGSVADLYARRGTRLAVPEAVLIGRHTADALVAAHEQDIIHRDLKPQNLLIDAYGRIKLCDFGIASLARSEEFQTRTNALSLRYASPEDLDEDAEVGPSSDVYSLGATLVHLVHGRPLTMRDRLQPWVAPATDDEQLAAIDRVIERCLRPDPDARPSSPEVLDQLEAIDRTLDVRCRHLPVESSAPSSGPTLSPDRGVARRDQASFDDDRPLSQPDRAGADPSSTSSSTAAEPSGLDDTSPPTPGPATAGETGPPPPVAPRDQAPFEVDRPLPRPDRAGGDASSTSSSAAAEPSGFDDTSSPTARRSDAVIPPARPRPPAAPERRRWPWVAGAIAIAAVIGVCLALLWPSSDDPDTQRPIDEFIADSVTATTLALAAGAPSTAPADAAISVVARPENLPSLDDASMTWPFGPVGECLVHVNGLDELMPVDCAEPHDLQRFAVDELGPDDLSEGDAYSADAVRGVTGRACRAAFVDFVGVEEPESLFRIAVTRPSADSWADGDRRFQCLLGVRDHLVTGNAASSRA